MRPHQMRTSKVPAAGLLTGRIEGVPTPVSRLVYGTLFLHTLPRDESFALLDAVWAEGCNAFDCAAIYGGGQCEAVLGQWMQSRGIPRERVVIISKGGCHGQDKLWRANFAEGTLEAELDGSLGRLGVSHLDAYLLHRDDPDVEAGAIVQQMHALVASRKIRAWGVSNWRTERVAAARAYAREHGLTPPVADSRQDSLAEPAQPVWPNTTFVSSSTRPDWLCATDCGGVALLGWECLAKGFMAGHWSEADALSLAEARRVPMVAAEEDPEGAARWRDAQLRAAYLTPANLARRARASQLAAALHVELPTLALGYVLSQPSRDFALIGTRRASHFRQAADAARRGSRVAALSSVEIAFLERGSPCDLVPSPCRAPSGGGGRRRRRARAVAAAGVAAALAVAGLVVGYSAAAAPPPLALSSRGGAAGGARAHAAQPRATLPLFIPLLGSLLGGRGTSSGPGGGPSTATATVSATAAVVATAAAAAPQPLTDGSLRLVGASTDAGAVEMLVDGNYTAVYPHARHEREFAEVVCRQLGYGRARGTMRMPGDTPAHTGASSAPVACAGDEAHLASCEASAVAGGHVAHVGVRCLACVNERCQSLATEFSGAVTQPAAVVAGFYAAPRTDHYTSLRLNCSGGRRDKADASASASAGADADGGGEGVTCHTAQYAALRAPLAAAPAAAAASSPPAAAGAAAGAAAAGAADGMGWPAGVPDPFTPTTLREAYAFPDDLTAEFTARRQRILHAPAADHAALRALAASGALEWNAAGLFRSPLMRAHSLADDVSPRAASRRRASAPRATTR